MNGGSFSGNPLNFCAAVTEGANNTITNYEVTGASSSPDDDFNDNTLDGKWTMDQVGNTTVANVSESGGTLTVTNRGVDLWTTDDDYTLVRQGPFTGDFTVTAKVNSLTNTNAWAKAGVLIIDERPNIVNRPKYAGMVVTPGNNFSLQTRYTEGGTGGADYGSVTGGTMSSPAWVRLVRTGDTVEGFYSTDGTNFTSLATDTVTFTGDVYTGVWTTSHTATATTTAVFDDFTTVGLYSPLYSGSSCSGVSTGSWADGTYNLNVTYTDSCSTTGQTVSGTFDFAACEDTTTPSSISFNGVNTAAGNFNGSSMVTPVDLNTLQYRITETTSGGTTTITRLDDWAAINTNNSFSYPVSNGNNRLLVVAISGEDTNNTAAVTNVQYGGQDLTFIGQAVQGTGYSNITWVGYCDETCLAAATNTNVTFTSTDLDSGFGATAAVYENVNQSSPIYASDTNQNTAGPITASLDHPEDGVTFYAVNFNGNHSLAQHVVSTGFANQAWQDLGGVICSVGVDERTATTVATPVNISTDATAGGDSRNTIVAVALNPASGTVEVERLAWNPDPQEATSVPLVDGNTYKLYARGTDPDCGIVHYVGGTSEPGSGQTFVWSSCQETKKVVLNPSVTTPLGSGSTTLSGQVQLIADDSNTGDSSEVSLDNSTWAATVNYTPAEDSNTPVPVYLRSTAGVCGSGYNLTNTLAVPVNTMAAPTITTFTGPSIKNTFVINNIILEASDNVGVTGYMITENDTQPDAGDAAWSGSVTSYTVSADGDYTLYPWAKDAAGNVSAVYGSPLNVTVDTTAPTDGVLTATSGVVGAIPLSWTAASDAGSGFASYDLRASDAGPVANCGGGVSIYSGTGTSYTHSGLEISATWYYRLCAIDNANNTSTGATASATTANCVDTGTTSVSINPDPGAGGEILYNVATLVNATASHDVAPEVQWSEDGGMSWSSPVASGSTYVPPTRTVGTVRFRSYADGSCAGNKIYSTELVRNIDSRIDPLQPVNDAFANQAGTTTIRVIFDYCDDLNGSGLFRVEYKLPTENWTDQSVIDSTILVQDGGAGDVDNSKNETVIVLVTGLTPDTIYDVRMTYVDADGLTIQPELTGTVSGDGKEYSYVDQVELITWVDDPVLHNALAFACSTPGYRTESECTSNGGTWDLDRKHTGGWGTPTGEYGAFLCKTCHSQNTTNIKRIRTSISFPNTASLMPNGTASASVQFKSADNGSSDFGNDADAHTSSNRVCEVCHSQTQFHNWDTTGQTDTDHQNQTDCIGCHSHKTGFRASCTSCHGHPPEDDTELVVNKATPENKTNSATFGKHSLHALDKGFDCNTCHNGWETSGEMPKGGDLNIGFKPSVNPQFNAATGSVDGGTYFGRTNGSYTVDGTTSTTVTKNDSKTCASVYCHGYATPVWDDAELNQPCGSCHGQTGELWGAGDLRNAAPDGDGGRGGKDLMGNTSGAKVGHHGKHIGYSQLQTNDPCNLCHDGFGYTFSTHVDGKVDINLRKVAKSETIGAGGAGVNATWDRSGPAGQVQCSNIDCHAGTYWDSGNTLTCTSAQGCHSYPPTSEVGSVHASTLVANTVVLGDVDHDIRGDGDVTILREFHDECTTCHGYKSNGSDTIDGFTPLTATEITALGGDPAITPFFTTYNASNPTGWHQDNKVGMNGPLNSDPLDDAGYNPSNGGCDNSACHPNDAAHRLPVGVDGSGSTIQMADIGPGDCGYCHDSGRGGAPTVSALDTHVDADGSAGSTYQAGDCRACHSGHWTDTTTQGTNRIGVSTIYNRTVVAGGNDTGTLVPTMSKQYPNHDSYILLGGTATAGYSPTSEAEYCWGCHDALATPVSEWGTNNNTLTGAKNYDFGDLYTSATTGSTKRSNWTTGFWRSGKGRASGYLNNPFWYKAGAIQSTHSVNFDTGVAAVTDGNSLGFNRTEAVDAVEDIRCTYCHDVHGTHNGANGDPATETGTLNDQPYLRGTWLTNPYPEDGAPQWGMNSFTNNGFMNVVPRGSASASNSGLAAVANAGGFWIDQNSGNPTGLTTGSTATQRLAVADNTSGLCEQCHGANKNGTWTQAAIGSIDYTTTGNEASNALWVSGYNGHANVVVGGPGRGANGSAESYARNIFTRTKRGNATMSSAESNHGNVDMGLATVNTDRGYAYRGIAGGYRWTPDAGDEDRAWRDFAWGGIVNGTRSPAAGSDFNANTMALTMSTAATEPANYDSQANYHTFTCSKCHNPHASRLPKLMITNCLDTNHNTWEDNTTYTGNNLPTPWTNTRHSQWAAAQNCHRVSATAPLATGASQALGTGWNKATPWQEYTNPNSTRTNPNP
ncbi:MAG: CxxxxCH/CxxCH domain-containing protein [Desulfuromonadales bacterium]|nr:CxxxxCH/CxxCH domain-containing protein [Desulfuromonadales bacterium]